MTEELGPALQRWRDRGRQLEVHGHRVFAMEASGPDGRPPLLVLHGFPTSSHDFVDVLHALTAVRSVILFDFPGFGLSAKPEDYSYSLLEQAEVAIGVWRALGLTGGHLLAHDYGTSVATELLARRARSLLPMEFRTVTLCNGSVHIELAKLTASQQILRNQKVGPVLAKLATRRFFKARMRAIWGDPAHLSDSTLTAMWEGIQFGGGRERISAISQYLDERHRFWHRWIGALSALDLPAHVLWGKKDPIAVPAIAEQLHAEIPGAQLSWLDDLGHYPMLEAPERWAAAVGDFLDAHD